MKPLQHRPPKPDPTRRHTVDITNEDGSVTVSGVLLINAPSKARRNALKAVYRKADLVIFAIISKPGGRKK